MTRQRNHIDLMTLLAIVTLMVLSLGVVYSASATWAMVKWGESGRLLGSHALKVLLGFVFLILFIQIDYHKYRKLTKPALLAAIVLLLFTLGLGGEVKGAARWLRFGGFSFQPSEFAKFALIFHLAVLMADKKERIDRAHVRIRSADALGWIGDRARPPAAELQHRGDDLPDQPDHAVRRQGADPASQRHGRGAGAAPGRLHAERRIPHAPHHGVTSTAPAAGRTNYQLWQAMIGFGNGGIFGLGPGE